MLNVVAFTYTIGSNDWGQVAGPGIVAYNLAKAVHQNPNLGIHFVVNEGPHGKFKETLDSLGITYEKFDEKKHYVPSFLKKFDVVHSLNSKDHTLRLLELGIDNLVAGPNVIGEPEYDPQTYELESTLIQKSNALSRYLTLNPELHAILAQRMGLSSERVIQWPTGIDTEMFKPTSGDSVIIWIGKYNQENKGGDLVKRITEDFPGIKLMTPTNLGVVDYHKMPELYSGHSILLSLSPHETQGLATMEAAAAGMSIIQTYLCRTKENRNILPWFIGPGYYVVPREYGDVKEALAFLLSNPELIKKMGGANRKWMELNYDLKRMGETYHRIIEEIVSNPPQRAIIEKNRPSMESRKGGNEDFIKALG